MADFPYDLDPFETDPGRWGASLVCNAELLLGCLNLVRPRSVVEVGAYAGDLTRLLLLWARDNDARVLAVDPSPQPELAALERELPELTLVRETSLAALDHIESTEAVVLDGDHNYYTVSEELRRIGNRASEAGRPFPLVLLHDVAWPHARRDDYFAPDEIPAEFRQPIAPGGGLFPGVETVRPGALPYRAPAASEGGPRNGVLTAVEDFVSGREDLALATVSSFFGFGVVWPRDAGYSDDLRALLAPWDGNALVARLEANRVLHLASSHVQLTRANDAEAKLARVHELLERMLVSRAFAAAEMFLRLRQRGQPAFSRAEILRLLGRRA